MKEVIIIHPSLNKAGGAEKVCLSTINALKRGGYNVKLFTIDETDWSQLKIKFEDITKPHEEFFLTKRITAKGELSQSFFIVTSYISMLLYNKISSDILVINTHGDLVSSIADICYVNAVPQRIVYQHSPNGSQSSFWVRLSAKAYDFFLKTTERVCKNSVLVVNSSFTKKVVKRYLKRDSIVVYPPVDTDKFSSNADVGTRENIILTVARFKKWKCLDIIPKIAKLVGRGKFLVLGSADETSNGLIKELTKSIEILGVGNRVELLINQPRQRYLEILKSAKVYLHTQPMEAFGIGIVEAMAAGCVPLVPQNGGPWLDILERKQGVYGFSYSYLNEAAAIITSILDNAQLCKTVALNAVQRARKFNSGNFESKILKLVNYVNGTRKIR